jgi:nickel/cobalt exporter
VSVLPDISGLIQGGMVNAWLLLPVAAILGALHALEPGHAKSMMAAFIIAIHGTVAQAVLLALSATVGHTIIVWALAILALQLQDTALLEKAEPWLLLLGGLLIVTLALRILSRLAPAQHAHSHGHDHHANHARSHGHDHGPEHAHEATDGDAHAAAHAADLKRRLAKGPVTDADVVWFGFSGGLAPCPAAFAVLLACLHQKAYGLGVVLVAAFSAGLAVMLVAIGVLTAWGAKALAARQPTLDRLSRWAPYVSAAIVLTIGLIITAQGLAALQLV